MKERIMLLLLEFTHTHTHIMDYNSWWELPWHSIDCIFISK